MRKRKVYLYIIIFVRAFDDHILYYIVFFFKLYFNSDQESKHYKWIIGLEIMFWFRKLLKFWSDLILLLQNLNIR